MVQNFIQYKVVENSTNIQLIEHANFKLQNCPMHLIRINILDTSTCDTSCFCQQRILFHLRVVCRKIQPSKMSVTLQTGISLDLVLHTAIVGLVITRNKIIKQVSDFEYSQSIVFISY
jgi:hypothetical protein